MFRDIRVPNGVVLVIAVVALVVSSVAIGAAVFGRSAAGSAGMMGGTNGAGMMGGTNGAGMMGGAAASNGPQPGTAGFVPGTASAPRVIRIYAGPGYTFSPSTIAVARGEAVTFEVTAMGPLVHEFMVGPADAVAADQHGTPEIADIRMMQTRSLSYAFDGAGPYAFACHADGHYEAGMHGTITVVG
jgi:plastocyanin